MRLEKRRKKFGRDAEGDMTPMVDMTFQLIAFFMVLINFTQAEQHKRITLPVSELAKPPEEQPEDPIYLHIDDVDDAVIFAGREYLNLEDLKDALRLRTDELGAERAKDTMVILRGDQHAKTGVVQQVIATAQEVGLEKFNLRAEQLRTGPKRP